MNFMVFLRARPERAAAAFKDWYLADFAPRLQQHAPTLARHVVNLTEAGPAELRQPQDSTDPGARYDVVAEMVLADVPAFRAAFGQGLGVELAAWADVINSYRVTEHVVLDRDPPPSGSRPGYKVMREMMFHADMPDSAARRSWTHHGSLALKVHVGMSRYVQNWVEERLSPNPPPTRGISELYFPDREAMVLRYYESPRGRAEVTHDAGHFIERQLPRVYAREHVLKA